MTTIQFPDGRATQTKESYKTIEDIHDWANEGGGCTKAGELLSRELMQWAMDEIDAGRQPDIMGRVDKLEAENHRLARIVETLKGALENIKTELS